MPSASALSLSFFQSQFGSQTQTLRIVPGSRPARQEISSAQLRLTGQLRSTSQKVHSRSPKSAGLVIALTEYVVTREKITTLMVTHSMHQAASLGDRLIMMHRGQIID